MSIRIECACGARLKVADSNIGKSVRCSACGNGIFVNKDAGAIQRANQETKKWIRVSCSCGKVIKAPPEWADKVGYCPRCGNEVAMTPSTLPGADDSAAGGSAISAAPTIEAPTPAKPRPTPQPRPAEKSGTGNRGVDDAAGRLSGLLDRTGREEIKIVDSVPPAVHEAKVAQRAKAIKASSAEKATYYSSRLDPGTGARGVFIGTRQWIRERPIVPLAASLVVLSLAGTMLARSFRDPVQPPIPWETVYAYDLNTGKIFTSKKTTLAPFPTESGKSPYAQPAGVWAVVFSCGSCADPATHFVGWIEALTTEARAAVGPVIADTPSGEPYEGMFQNALGNVENAIQIADPKNPNSWLTATDPEAIKLMLNLPVEQCKEAVATRCKP